DDLRADDDTQADPDKPPEDASHHFSSFIFRDARRIPAKNASIFTSGFVTAAWTVSEITSTFVATRCTEPPIESTRSSSLLTPRTVFPTSPISGTDSDVMPSTRSFKDVTTRNRLLITTATTNSTSAPVRNSAVAAQSLALNAIIPAPSLPEFRAACALPGPAP